MLSKQLQEQIEQEAKSSAADFNYYPGSTECEDLESSYTTAATKYGLLYETALARAERAEKALREIKELAVFPKTENESGVAIYNILKICEAALTPKTGEDESIL